ncbi:MAG TPA: serine hydrolase [Bacteroidetes bacterium]|nr:serine hydrolase [Bacteroidota bacterium]
MDYCIECLHKYQLSLQQEKNIRDQIHADRKRHQLDSLFTYRAKKLGFNGNVLVIQKGVLLYENSFGYENYRKKTPLSAASKFQLASISKTFTAVAVLHLIEIGKLSLNDSIQSFYPDFPIHNITLKLLLSHRSGLPDYRFAYEDSASLGFGKIDNQMLIQWMTKNPPPLQFQPDRKFTYCNTNYAVLAAIVEHVTGMKFDVYMQQYILRPIGLNHTYIITTADTAINSHKTTGYNSNWSEIPRDGFDGIVGDKGVYSTTEDLQTWYRMLNSDCFLKKETLAMAFEPRSFEKQGKKNYGYGFRINEYEPGKKCIYHNGWWKGYNTAFYTNPQEEYCIIVLGNRFNKSPYMLKEVMQILHEGSLEDSDTDDGAE